MEPFLGEPFAARRDVHVIPTYWPIPNAGVLPMNAFLVNATRAPRRVRAGHDPGRARGAARHLRPRQRPTAGAGT